MAGHFFINRFFLGAVLIEIFFFIPLGAYLYFFYPDWSLMYFLDPASMEEADVRLIGVAALSLYFVFMAAGFALGSRLVRMEKTRAAVIVFAASALALGVFSLLTYSRLTQVGLYAEWAADPRATTHLMKHAIGYVIGVDAAAAGVFLLMLLNSFRKNDIIPAVS